MSPWLDLPRLTRRQRIWAWVALRALWRCRPTDDLRLLDAMTGIAVALDRQEET